ncbi:MAG TPA: SRPBCC domain-containing protein [Patescibacteria group bacterium]|nr:SRPBCC domain-containing protein [Patescibacteria group bacterium]
MSRGLVAKSEITINAPASTVWKVLTTPATVKKLMFGADVITDWKGGSTIIYKGMWQGKPFEDKGEIVTFQPEKLLVTTHWSPLSGITDTPENYHTVSYELTSEDNKTKVVLTQDNNASEDEKSHSESNWQMMLENFKKIAETL